MDDNRLLGLIYVFVPLSLLSFGGGQAVVAEIQHQTVGVWGWLSGQQFSDAYGISRAAPGPSTLIAALIGYQVAGFFGSLVATLAIYIPSSIVVAFTASWWQRHPESRFKRAFERSLGPVAMGLVFAGALAVIEAGPITWFTLGTTAVCCAILYVTKISPYWLVIVVGGAFFGLSLAGLSV
jgi:chromate transporter